MRAVIAERALPPALAPLLEHRPAALLPVANRALIDLQLEALASIGVTRLDLYLRTHPEQVRAHVRSGERWGVEVRCHSVRRPEACLAPGVAWRCDDVPVLAMALELLWNPGALARLLSSASAGLLRPTAPDGSDLPMFLWLPGASAERRETAAEGWQLIDGASTYAAANRTLLHALDGTPHIERAYRNGLYLGAGARVDDSARVCAPALIGREARIGAAVVIGADSVVGDGCLVDRGAEIDGCVILADTYVGPASLLRDKIVDGGWLIDIHDGHATYIDDPVMLGACARREPKPSMASRAAHRAIACLALLAALPLAMLWGGWQRICGRGALVSEVRYLQAGRDLCGRPVARTLTLYSLAAPGKAWRRLPWLIEVVRGQLALVGDARPPCRADSLSSTATRYALVTLQELGFEGQGNSIALLLQGEPRAAWQALRVFLGMTAEAGRAD